MIRRKTKERPFGATDERENVILSGTKWSRRISICMLLTAFLSACTDYAAKMEDDFEEWKTVRQKYEDFAKVHYSIGRYERGMRDLFNADAANYESEFRRRYLGNRESFCKGIFGTAVMYGCYDKENLYRNDVEYVAYFVNTPMSLGEEMEKFMFYSTADIFQFIADDAYVLGWDDVQDFAIATSLGLEEPNSATEKLGASTNQKEYRSLRSKAGGYYKTLNEEF